MALLGRRVDLIPQGHPVRPRAPAGQGFGGVTRRLGERVGRFVRSRRRVKPTAEGWVFLGAAFAVAMAALNTGNNLLYLVFATMLSMIVLSGVLSELSVQQVEVSRRISERVYARTDARGTWMLHNPRRLFANLAVGLSEGLSRDARLVGAATARFTLLAGGQTDRRDGTWRFERRGVHRLSAIRVSTTWPFGIFEKWYELAAPMEVLVHPQPLPGGVARPLTAPSVGDSRAGPRRGGGDLLGLRLHRNGEDRRLIHWRTSARLGRRIAVERAEERGGRVLVTVGTPAPGPAAGEAFELAVSLATGAVLRSLAEGRRVVLQLPGSRLEGGADDSQALLRALALAELPVAS